MKRPIPFLAFGLAAALGVVTTLVCAIGGAIRLQSTTTHELRAGVAVQDDHVITAHAYRCTGASEVRLFVVKPEAYTDELPFSADTFYRIQRGKVLAALPLAQHMDDSEVNELYGSARNAGDLVGRSSDVIKAGWPLACFQTRAVAFWLRDPTAFDGYQITSIPGQASFARTVWIPTRPMWRSVVIDSGFWFLIWVGVWFACRRALRFIRVRMGHCPKCAYDRQGQFGGPCPECGVVTRSPVRAVREGKPAP